MKHNILLTLLFVAVVSSGMFSACTDYTEDIQSPNMGQDLNGGGDNKLPPHLQKPNEGEFSEEKMLVNIGLNVILKNVDEFYVETRRLKRDISDRCSKLQNGVSEQSHLTRVQEQWKKAMLAYHRLDAAPIGPLMDNSGILANNIYAWPFVNFCGIDLEVARYAKGGGTVDLPTNKKGLGAFEYLLFTATDKISCPKSALNKDAVEWLAKSELEKNLDRCHFEEKIVDDLEIQAKTLFTQWDISQKNFSKTLIDGSKYAGLKVAVNALTDAMFSIEIIKDAKLGIPLGIIKGCEDESGLCPLQTEHILSGLALESIEVQVATFKEVFYGSMNSKTKAFGFDDYLISKGHQDVVDDFASELTVIEKSIVNAQAGGALKDQVAATDKATCDVGPEGKTEQPVCQLFIDIRQLTNLLKGELLTVLSLEAPAAFQGDND